VKITTVNEKQRSERRKHCALAVVRWSQKFSPRRRPLPGGTRWPKFNQLDGHYNYRPSLVKIRFAISSYRGNRPTQTHTHKHTDRTDYNTLCH